MYPLVVLSEVEAVAWGALEWELWVVPVSSQKAATVHVFCLPTANTYLLAIHHFSCPTHYDPLGSFVEDDNHQNHRGHSGPPGSFVEDDSLSHTYDHLGLCHLSRIPLYVCVCVCL